MFIQSKNFNRVELEQFRDFQRLSFSILENMATQLVSGQTERDVARELVRRYRKAGFSSFFHLPVVLFGERTALPGDFRIDSFFPKKRALQAGDSVVLDAAPISAGYLVDTSYSFCFGEDDVHRDMMLNLATFRKQILGAVNNGDSFKSIAEKVEADIRSMGYEPVHSKHPGEVLGHRAVKLPKLPFTWRFRGFDALSLGWFSYKDKVAQIGIGREDPLWNTSACSDHPPHDGLWLVEPHAGKGSVGAKWEEILVIEKGVARWLDDSPPHVRQVKQIKQGDSYAPSSCATGQ